MNMAKKSVYVEQVHAREEKGRKKWPLVLAGVAVLAVAGGIGSTFAANITLNSGNDVEFAQGTQVVSACDPNIETSLTSRVASGTFYVQTVDVTIDTTACAGANLVVRLADSGNNLLTIGGGSNLISIDIDAVVAASGANVTLTAGTASVTGGVITITPGSDVAASSVDKVLIETN
jgi:hypothetical protein